MSGVATGSRPRSLQRVADQPRDQVVRHVVQDLVLVALPDDRRGHFARPKPGHARRPGIILRDPLDLGLDDVRRDLER